MTFSRLEKTLKITCLAALIFGAAVAAMLLPVRGAGTQQYTNAVTPLLDAAAGKSIGSVGPGAALDIVGQSGGMTHVTLHGWSAQGSSAIVFTSPDKHIVELSGFTGHGTNGASQAVSGTTYNAVTIDGWVASNALVDDVQTVWKAASALYAQKCGSCHALQPANSYSANQWPGVMKTQSGNAGLDPGQTALITTYLQVQSGR